jgi:peroxiredoxin
MCKEKIRSSNLLEPAFYFISIWLATAVFGCAGSSPLALKNAGLELQSLPDVTGRQQNLGNFGGKVVLVNVWATWCKECSYEMEVLNVLHRRLSGDGLRVVAVLVDDTAERGRSFVDEKRIGFPVLFDGSGEFRRALNVRALPASFLIACSGEVIHRFNSATGARINGWSDPRASDLLLTLLRGEGCEDPSSHAPLQESGLNTD